MFRHKAESTPAVTETYQMQQRMLSFGDDFWIENGLGQRAYRVNGKVFRLRKTFTLEDAEGNELLRVRSKVLRVRSSFTVERAGTTVATLHKGMFGFRDRFTVKVADGADLKARGNILDHDYVITRDGEDIARVSKQWIRARDTYGVAVTKGEDVPLLLAIVVCVDALSHPDR
ncbi:LURP-one-related/scramblase family protein [Actinocorallia sp. A-T 12471]|uniref:LURP-one-related/scramblase family protein n=1 Tax=Actinocorallia sp. A-T 12471 TaxID=3089813 RepID=UPI0029D35D41|nr:LURP-one-related family protein [Actinocorallia sp. A-T 12471]MDX6744161.1 LURP-one-related family protein [Actinocorallia sp. A-T 12471]